MKNGRIPERMVAYLKAERTGVGDGASRSGWSFPADRRETPGFTKYQARPAFVVPADSDAFKASGAKWASETVYGGTPQAFDTHGFENKPFTNLRWVGIDSRMEGGVAYKAVTQEGWLVDIREDVLIECLFEGAIQQLSSPPQGAGTYFTGEFIWVVMGSQSRIVRVGSKLYNEIADSDERRTMVDIPDAELEIGGVYQNRQGKQFVLLARGKQAGHKYLTIELHRYGERGTDQEIVDGSISVLDKPSVIPYWHWSGSFKVIKRTGTVKVPVGLGDRFDGKVKAVQRSATRWNEGTSR